MTRQCEDLTRDMLHAVTTMHKKAMPHITRADANVTWATMTEIQLLCKSRTHNMKLVYHINNKSSAHGLTVADEIHFLTRERQTQVVKEVVLMSVY